MNPTFKYWLDIGKTNGQYTLHRRLVNRPEHEMVKEYTYIKNVGRVFEEACQRADEYIAKMHTDGYEFDAVKDYDVSEGAGNLRHPGKYDDDVFWFGKYADKLIEDVLCDDPDYCMYIRDNFFSNKPRMNSLIKKFQDMDLGKSKQQLAIEERERKDAELAALLKPIPVELETGRNTFTGEILATYSRDYGYGEQRKMIFVDDRGFKINGSFPSAVNYHEDGSFREEIKGIRIEFDATLTISDDDNTFGFFKRPTKVSVITCEETS